MRDYYEYYLLKQIDKLKAEKNLLSHELQYYHDRCADLEEIIEDASRILNGE